MTTPRRCIFLLMLLALAGCGREATTPAATVENGADLPADQIVYDLRHSMTEEGVRKANLAGDTAYLREGGSTIDLIGVRLDFFDANGQEAGYLTSRTGEYNVGGGTFIARGDVVLITQDAQGGERRLETDELHFDARADQLWSDVPFVLHQAGRVTEGESFRSDARFENFTIQGATGTIPTDGSQGIRF